MWWSEWINLGKPTSGPNGGDDESIQKIISAGYHICSAPEEVQCRSILHPGLPMSEMGQTVTCNKDVGFICNNKQQGPKQQCFDYEIRLKCCGCQTPSTTGPTTPSTPSTTVTTTTPSTPSTTNNYNTLNYFNYRNNYNTLNYFNYRQLQNRLLLPPHNNYNTLNSFHYSNNYNTLNSFHYSNNYNTLNSFHYSNNYNTPTPSTTVTTTTPSTPPHSNNYNTLNYFHYIQLQHPQLFHYSNNYNTLNSFHSNNYNTLNSFHYSNNYNTLNSFHHSNNYNTLNSFHYSNNYNTLNSFHYSNNYNTLNSFHYSNNYNTLNSFHYIYNETDHDGYCYTGYCNESCHVVTIEQPCHHVYCFTLQGPKLWIVSDCTNATCINGSVSLAVPYQKPVVCANNFAAIKCWMMMDAAPTMNVNVSASGGEIPIMSHSMEPTMVFKATVPTGGERDLAQI
ncbi:hypothetical protein F7725_026928 [Dissostichus mawsoni]|uniref:WxxW domain-containing protein n=1 Tax=Dissostichus mawsoni TaxID=36200 RepID=A0A7J5X8V3_DISMA|nr:hypothetical protein F7725_026928 [Dissostichus mawsoni]